jgi:hypothetical protein
MPSVADMMAKSLDPAHIVVGMSLCNEMVSTHRSLFAHIIAKSLVRILGLPLRITFSSKPVASNPIKLHT